MSSSGQVFYNWKGQLRTRAKKLKQIQDGKTGVDDKLALQKLTDVEKRALKLWKEDFQDKDIASVSIAYIDVQFIITSLSCAMFILERMGFCVRYGWDCWYIGWLS